ncbi:hypothetical protein ABW19_dt0204751 [Dactylella cylindrospora]|nr:hypothetical protein ABW19_dt0204751 [Dactylella cylindrospora]
MVGPGTGLAPMRALIWERILSLPPLDPTSSERLIPESGLKPGKNLLFFGCRGKRLDYYFRGEWEELEREYGEDIFEVKNAFSRDPVEEGGKKYVQDVIFENKEEVWKLIGEQNGVVYVCGSAGKMPLAVKQSIIGILDTVGGLGREKAEAYVYDMENTGRYREEAW